MARVWGAGSEEAAVSRRGHPERTAEGEAVLLVVASKLRRPVAAGQWEPAATW